jgi:hypothetical protein
MSSYYTRIFSIKTFLSTDLQDRDLYDNLIESGHIWIKRKHIPHFHNLVRDPTVGCWVEVSRLNSGHCVPITSVAGKKIINKICYI